MDDDFKVTLLQVENRDAMFHVILSERAVRALDLIGKFGVDALEKSVAAVLSPSEAKRHAYGLRDLQQIGGVAHASLLRLADARSVMEGRKVAADPKALES